MILSLHAYKAFNKINTFIIKLSEVESEKNFFNLIRAFIKNLKMASSYRWNAVPL